MKFIINTTNLQSGGALQVALSILEEWKIIAANHEFHVLLSPQLNDVLEQKNFTENFRFYTFQQNPASTILSSLTFGNKLKKIEQKVKPDAVFSVFGPALWKPKCPHLVGFANGYYLFDKADFIQQKIINTLFRKIKYYGRRIILFYQLKKEAKQYWVETIAAKEKLATIINNAKQKISVIGNTYGNTFKNNVSGQSVDNAQFSLLYVSAYYQHKNFEIIPKVISILEAKNVACIFTLTLPDSKFHALFGDLADGKYLLNAGPVNPSEIFELYQKTDAVFMPSVLETFSANYPEAMISSKPIMSSNRDFATSICKEAAQYFDPENATEIADKIVALIADKELQKQLIKNGKIVLQSLETPESRAEKLLNLLIEMARTQNKNN